MIEFAALLDQLAFAPGRLAKLALLKRFFASVPDPDRGWALAALTGGLDFPAAKAGLVRRVAEARLDPVLFRLSYDFVGDLAETVALMWPAAGNAPPSMAEVVAGLTAAKRADLPVLLTEWLDRSDASTRYALLKWMTGALRVGVSARLAKAALADLAAEAGQPITADDIEEVWHGLRPPYADLFAWLEGRGETPDASGAPVFRPPMLAHPLEPADFSALDPDDYIAEWKWDGVRVQLVCGPGGGRIFTRTGDDISASFPEIATHLRGHFVLDGELLVRRAGEVAPFADLQQRLNRAAPSARFCAQYPAFVRLYDMLFDGAEDLRGLDLARRRGHLQNWFEAVRPAYADLSPWLAFNSLEALAALREGARGGGLEGLMLKRLDSIYQAGRPRGPWWKWKRDPLRVDAVLMYAQRGHGRRGSYYSDYTFGVWRGDVLVPIGKAYSGFTDEELTRIDRWVRANTVASFGPVREVAPGLVLEIAFDAAQFSARHKSGVALRFPRIARLRWDKSAAEADRLEAILRLIEPDQRGSKA